jgi:hypothetical protein
MRVTAGTRFGPYTVVALLGKGGMGEVYRAHDARLGRDVAIKVLPAAMASDAAALARFEREARAVAALNHPAIVALHDIGTEDGVAYVVIELLEGETLRERLDRDGSIPPRRALAIAAQVAQGLGAAHARGIVHRDVKPENLFLLDDGRVKVLDFGIARQASGEPVLPETVMTTQPGVVMGTFGYLAPEVIRGEPATPQSDMFAFGLVLYEALTGANPFLRETVAETVSAVLRDEPPPLGRAVPGLPPAAARLVHRCLEPRPDDRPDSLRDVAYHLETLDAFDDPRAAESGGAVEAAGGPQAAAPTQVGVTLTRMRQWLVMGVASSLLALMLASYVYVSTIGAGTDAGAPAAHLARVPGIVARTQQIRLEQLQLTARLVATFPNLKDVLANTDTLTIREFLKDYQRTSNVPLLVALDVDGRVLGATDESGIELGRAVDSLISLREAPTGRLITIDGRPHHAASAAAEAGGAIFGVVVAAAPLDDEFARTLRDATEDEAVLLDAAALRGSSLRSTAVPWPTLGDWRADGGAPDAVKTVTIGAQQFLAREVPLSPDGALVAVVLRERRTDAAAPQRVRVGLLVIGVVLLVVGVGLSWWLPGRLAARG